MDPLHFALSHTFTRLPIRARQKSWRLRTTRTTVSLCCDLCLFTHPDTPSGQRNLEAQGNEVSSDNSKRRRIAHSNEPLQAPTLHQGSFSLRSNPNCVYIPAVMSHLRIPPSHSGLFSLVLAQNNALYFLTYIYRFLAQRGAFGSRTRLRWHAGGQGLRRRPARHPRTAEGGCCSSAIALRQLAGVPYWLPAAFTILSTAILPALHGADGTATDSMFQNCTQAVFLIYVSSQPTTVVNYNFGSQR